MYPQGYGYVQGGYGYDYSQYWMASAAAYAAYNTANGALGDSSASNSGATCQSSSSDSDSSSSSSSSSFDASENEDLTPDPNKGKKGDYTNLLDEMKAKQKLRDEQRLLQQRLNETNSRRKREVLQERLHNVENQLRQMGESLVTVLDSNTGRLRSSRTFGFEPSDFRQPGDDRADQFARLLHAVEEYLRSRDGHCSVISEAEGNSKVQREWADLVQSRIIPRSVKLKHVLQERKHLFRVSRGKQGQTTVGLAGAGSGKSGLNAASRTSNASAPDKASNMISSAIASVASQRAAAKSEALAAAAAAEHGRMRQSRPTEVAILEAEASLPEGGLLRPDQVSAIEAHLDKVGGEERVSRLSSLFNVDKAQLRPHFQLYDKSGKLLAAPKPRLEGPGSANAESAGCSVTRDLQSLIQRLTTSRVSIGEAMLFCIDAAEQQAAPLARLLVRALEERDLRTEKVIARLFLVSDILHNSGAAVKGASRYRTSFQDLLPDAFEKLGRTWFNRTRHRHREHPRAKRAVRKVLEAWRVWEVFPPLFLRGLESLLFTPVPENDVPELEADHPLEQRVARWCGAADAARLPYAARLRGLSGTALPTSVCRARLCHFERYWYHAGVESTKEEEEDPWGEALRPTVTWSTLPESAENNGDLDGDEILSIDGESLSDADHEFAALQAGFQNKLEENSKLDGQDSDMATRLYDHCLSPCKRSRFSTADESMAE